MKLFWATPAQNTKGASFGYSSHIRALEKALISANVKVTADPRDDYDLAIHIDAANNFNPIEGRKNIFYTMTETSPALFQNKAMAKATALVFPTEFSRQEYKKLSFLQNVPMHVVPEGVDASRFPFVQRKKPEHDKPFIFLFLGAVDRRKGVDLVEAAFRHLYAEGRLPENSKLIIKTTGLHRADGRQGPQRHSCYGVSKVFIPEEKLYPLKPGFSYLPEIEVDNRNQSSKELTGIYESAHCFILPSRGEGWALSLSEALSTGLPSIWTDWSAPHDLYDEQDGFPLKNYRMASYCGLKDFQCAEADVEEIAEKMLLVYDDYESALEKGRHASEKLHANYSWTQSAERFIEVCKLYCKEAQNAS